MSRTAVVAFVLACVACGGGGDSSRRWLDATWSPVEGDIKGIPFSAEVPEKLPANADYMLGRDWWVNADREPGNLTGGPRLTLTRERHTYGSPEAFARSCESDPNRDLDVTAVKKLPDGRFRYARTLKGGTHVEVYVWIPWNDEGVRCDATWWGGMDDRGEAVEVQPRDETLAWLDRFCAHVTLRDE